MGSGFFLHYAFQSACDIVAMPSSLKVHRPVFFIFVAENNKSDLNTYLRCSRLISSGFRGTGFQKEIMMLPGKICKT